MHSAAGNQRFIGQSVDHIRTQLASPTQAVVDAIGTGMGTNDATAIEGKRTALLAHLDEVAQNAKDEPSHDDQHYVSRFDGVGLFQSALSRIFAERCEPKVVTKLRTR